MRKGLRLEDQFEDVQNPFEDVPNKYEKYNYSVGQMQAMALSALWKNQQILQKRLEEHEKAHVVASRAAMNAMDMPPSVPTPEKPN